MLLLSLIFLFFIQQLTLLVEAVYRFNLLDTSFGGGTAGLVCFLSPLYLYFKKKGLEQRVYQFLWIILLLQGFIPWLPNPWRIAAAGCGVAFFLIILVPLLTGTFGNNPVHLAAAAALSVLLSVSLRAGGSTVDLSLNGASVFLGWLLIFVAAYLLHRQILKDTRPKQPERNHREESSAGPYFSMIAIFAVIAYIYFILASPGIVARWMEADYLAIHLILSLAVGLAFLFLNEPDWLRELKKWQIVGWNLLFFLTLLLAISLHMIRPAATAADTPLIQTPSSIWQNLPVYFLFVLSPVLFIDLAVFCRQLSGRSAASLAGPALAGALFLLAVILILILANVWGYTGSIGRFFRQRFYLPFLILDLGILLPLWTHRGSPDFSCSRFAGRRSVIITGFTFCLIIVTAVIASAPDLSGHHQAKGSLVVMTFNVQQGTDCSGNSAFSGQLAVIGQIDPDILCLQESDGARISGGNMDIVRYFADHLGYYSYFGPNSISGTFGTAILSRFPLFDCRTIFTYSDKDEIGTALCSIHINNETIQLVNSHPDGSVAAKQAHLNMLMKLVEENKQIIAAGDYNFEPESPFYKQITSMLSDSWRQRDFPSVSKRIDYIFLSKNFRVIKRYYIPSPASDSDHPAYGVEIKMTDEKMIPAADQAAEE